MAQSLISHSIPLSDSSRTEISSAWESAIADHPASPAVLTNAAKFFERTDPERALDLLKQAQSLSPNSPRFKMPIADIYAAAEAQPFRSPATLPLIPMSAESGAKLRDQLFYSTDPELLANSQHRLHSGK